MKKSIVLTILLFSLSSATYAKSKYYPAKNVIEARDCILELIAPQMYATLDPAKPKPTIRPQTEVTLTQFQDAIEPFWGFRPDVITNVFNLLKNEIFLMTERKYYESKKRYVFDSLAHELAHYIQYEYKQADFFAGDDFLEMQAIDVQTWFRDTYAANMKTDKFNCPIQIPQTGVVK